MDVKGRVSSLSSCAALTFRCSSGYNDDNGHGTSTAAIGAGALTSTGQGMSGVAPAATIIEEKVLNSKGSGYDVDVANGINKAVDAGAGVINLSLTYTPTSNIVNAINYAASRGVIIVFAGGNSSAFLNDGGSTTGLTQAALSHLVFVGSVDSNNRLSSFSNVPGTGWAYSNSASASYASLWLMAPGESIIAPGIQYGSTAFAYWTGTSMAAPMVSGALALLETEWPILRTNGTATALLFQTATDLGATGVDSTYGNGLLNIAQAFQPVGTLSVDESSGTSVPVSQLHGGKFFGGSIGAVPALINVLSNYNSFDDFARNFPVDLSGYVSHQSAGLDASAPLLAAMIDAGSAQLADGGAITYARFDGDMAHAAGMLDRMRFGSDETGFSHLGEDSSSWVVALSNRDGSQFAAGRGFPASASFADALWGPQSLAADQANVLASANALGNLAQGGYFMAFGSRLGDHTRMAVSWSNTQSPNQPIMGNQWILPNANSLSAGLTTELGQHWMGGLTVDVLNEHNGLLGTTYDSASGFGLGAQHTSTSLGVSSSLGLWHDAGMLFEASLATTGGAPVNGGLITGTSRLFARSYGVSFIQRDAFDKGDRLTLSLSRPLSVMSGSLGVLVTGVDGQGIATTKTIDVSLRPSGQETDLSAGYSTAWGENASVFASLTGQSDAGNVAGRNAIAVTFGAALRF